MRWLMLPMVAAAVHGCGRSDFEDLTRALTDLSTDERHERCDEERAETMRVIDEDRACSLVGWAVYSPSYDQAEVDRVCESLAATCGNETIRLTTLSTYGLLGCDLLDYFHRDGCTATIEQYLDCEAARLERAKKVADAFECVTNNEPPEWVFPAECVVLERACPRSDV